MQPVETLQTETHDTDSGTCNLRMNLLLSTYSGWGKLGCEGQALSYRGKPSRSVKRLFGCGQGITSTTGDFPSAVFDDQRGEA